VATKKTGVVLVGGCFDILHYGHVYFLKKAKLLGSCLIVALESDENIKRLKGKNRPIHNLDQRREILEALTFVDSIIVLKNKMTDGDYLDLVKNISPSIIATTKGDTNLEKKRGQARLVGAKVVEIPKIKVASTSQIIKLLDID